MEKATRRRYTLGYKQEVVRLVESGQKVPAAASSLGVVDKMLARSVKAHGSGMLMGVNKPQLTAGQIDIRRLRAELARVTMECDILLKAALYFAKVQR